MKSWNVEVFRKLELEIVNVATELNGLDQLVAQDDTMMGLDYFDSRIQVQYKINLKETFLRYKFRCGWLKNGDRNKKKGIKGLTLNHFTKIFN